MGTRNGHVPASVQMVSKEKATSASNAGAEGGARLAVIPNLAWPRLASLIVGRMTRAKLGALVRDAT